MAKASKQAATSSAGKKKPAAAPKAKEKEVVLVGSKVKAAIRDAGCNTGGDVMDALNEYVHWILAQATSRASANNRKTVRGHDILSQM